MSIVNVHLAGESALIAVDTDGRPPEGPDITMCKMLPLPLSNSIFACRGERTFYYAFWAKLMFADSGSFDELADKMVGEYKLVAKAGLEYGPDMDIDGTFLMVGWSDEAQAMRCVFITAKRGGEFEQYDSMDGFKNIQAPNWNVNPINTPELMFECGKVQVFKTRPEEPEFAIGGDMLVATLTRDSMTIRNMGDLG